MKRILIMTLALVLLLGLAATPVMAAKGAVKADLTYYEPLAPVGVDPVVGSVILNTTASGSLIVVVNMDTIPDMADYDIRVWVNGDPYTFVDVLSTNAKGNGNAQVKVDVSSYSGETLGVDVVLRPNFVDVPLPTPCYTTNWPTDVIVPLK